MSYSTILYETSDDGVATVTLNRPQAMNSFNQEMLDECKAVWHEIKHDVEVRAVVPSSRSPTPARSRGKR